ncbi:uncharacterized protein TNCV_26871 [Trichonephila clavipes]|uniref:Reverse transcriptase domain-containing protein n=1 Tax=Trichonephila clavipes TaxID=2585209 RepID=A0A8X7BNE3_TRICX|nr:uncharacterized protein TNCV_26871 [Trichonephila clavipes]
MKIFWRFTAALTCATALLPGFLFKPVLSMRPERRAALARKLKKLIDDYEDANTPKLCKKLNLPLKELLKWLFTCQHHSATGTADHKGKKSNVWKSGDRDGLRTRPSCMIQRLKYAIFNQSRMRAQKYAGASPCIIHSLCHLPCFLENCGSPSFFFPSKFKLPSNMYRQILERTREFGIDTHHLFIDFKTAYGSINRKALIAAMKEFKIIDKLLRLISLTLSQTKILAKVQNDLSDPLEIKRRSTRSCSSVLFSLIQH